MPKERWKVVEGHPNYMVSDLGKVRNIRTGKLLKPYDDGKEYLRVKIDGRCERVHILVAVAFIPNPEGKNVVNHKRGKKHDCRASQLEWVTQSENIQHAWRTGLFKTKKNKSAKEGEKWQRKRTLKTKLRNGLIPLVFIHWGQAKTR